MPEHQEFQARNVPESERGTGRIYIPLGSPNTELMR